MVSGGKQYKVALGERILVDRIAAEPGSSVKLDRVLLYVDGEGTKVGTPVVDGIDVDAKVIAHERGPRTESIRYKSKKRVRVHRGGRSYLTALEIIAVGGIGREEKAGDKEEMEAEPKRGRAKKAAPKKNVEAKAVEPVEDEETEEPEPKTPKRSSRRTKKETK